MAKNNGFLIYERQENPCVSPEKRLESFDEFHVPYLMKNEWNRLPAVCTAAFHSASRL